MSWEDNSGRQRVTRSSLRKTRVVQKLGGRRFNATDKTNRTCFGIWPLKGGSLLPQEFSKFASGYRLPRDVSSQSRALRGHV